MSTEATTHTGKVKFFNKNKGYGYIISPDHPVDVFFHASNTGGKEDMMGMDQPVSFEATETKKGIAAVNVIPL